MTGSPSEKNCLAETHCKKNIVFVLRVLLFPSRGGRTKTLSSGDFTDWMSFLPTNLIEEISRNPEALNENT